MKRVLTVGSLAALTLASCVSLSEHESLQTKYSQTERAYTMSRQELLELKEENAELTRQNQAMAADMSEMVLGRAAAESAADSLQRRIEQLNHHYDTTMENYIQEVAGKSRDLTRAQNLLSARTKELAEKERELQKRQQQLDQEIQTRQQQLQQQEDEFSAQRTELLARQHQLEQQEAATRSQLQAVRNSVTNALTGFADKGMNVEVKDGKVYVSMDNKLLFPSASWTASKDGIAAISELAKVLEADTTLTIMVEGHTDNDAYRGSTAVKDNWDLSVMRATAVVKLLLKHGPGINPSRIEACGHGEYAPKVPNDSPANKAINRRTEIILTPDLDKLLRTVGN